MDMEGGPTQLPLAEQIQQIGSYRLGIQLFRTLAIIASKPLDTEVDPKNWTRKESFLEEDGA
jgi:hypothetical protein